MELVEHEVGADDRTDVEIRLARAERVGRPDEAGEELIDGAEGERRLEFGIVGILPRLDGRQTQAELLHVAPGEVRASGTIEVGKVVAVLAFELARQDAHGYSVAAGERKRGIRRVVALRVTIQVLKVG